MQRVLHIDVQCIRKIAGEEALWGAIDEGLHGRQQRSEAREPDRLVGPETFVVKMRDLAQSVVSTAVGIAGHVAQTLQLAKHRKAGVSAESTL